MLYDLEGNNVETKSGVMFVSDDSQSEIATYADMIALYDALVSNYPDYVSKNTITSGSFTNYEYVFTTGAYNKYTGTAYAKDSPTQKPKILLTSGTHGHEHSAATGNYVFCKALCEGAVGLQDLRESIEFRTIPVVNPSGYTADTRQNSNGVDLNRNYDSSWQSGSTGYYYPGTSAASEAETKAIQSWLQTHSDAALFIDHHDSERLYEYSLLMAFVNDARTAAIKDRVLRSMNPMITRWKLDRNLPASGTFFYCGVATSYHGMLAMYARDQGIPSYLVETSWNANGSGKHSKSTIGIAAEAQAAILLGSCDYITGRYVEVTT